MEDTKVLTKICTKCPEGDNVKPITEFYKHGGYKDGLSAHCKTCHKKAEARPERVANRKAYQVAYHVKNAEKINARTLQWQKDNPERANAKSRRSKKKRLLEQVAAGLREMPAKRRDRKQALVAGEKECSQCEVMKLLEEFYDWERSPDGKQSECKDCHDGRSQPIYSRDESIIEKECTKCGETKIATEFYDNAYIKCGMRSECKTCTDAKNNEWATAHPDEHKAIANGYAHRARQDPEKGPLIRARSHVRRAQIKQAPIIDPVIDIAVLYIRDKGICSLCHKTVKQALHWPDPMSATMDHIIPLTKGGEHSWKNVALAHFICNTRKNNRIQTQQLRLF